MDVCVVQLLLSLLAQSVESASGIFLCQSDSVLQVGWRGIRALNVFFLEILVREQTILNS